MAKASTRTSAPTIKNHRGFSLIEIMLVLAIAGIIVTFGSRAFINKNTRIRSAVRRFSTMIKKLRNRARIENRTYRMVFDLPRDKDRVQSYWVEVAGKDVKLMTEEELEEKREALEDENEGKVVDPQGFVPAGGFGGDQGGKGLPQGLYFESIEVAGDEDVKKTGRIYIFFFPQGFVQESAIHITDRDKLHWTLAIHPLTGKVDIIPRYTRLEELMEDE